MSLFEFTARLRKRLKEETASTLTMRYLNFHLMSVLAAERGQEKAAIEAFRLGFEAGISAMTELVRLEPMTASLKMGKALARAAWYLFSVKFPTKAEAYEPKPGHYLLIYEDEDCP